MWTLSSLARGFVSRVSRKRGAGEKIDSSEALESDIIRCRSATSLPIAACFGIKEKAAGLQDFDDFQPSRTILECPLNGVLGAEHLHQALIFDRIEDLNKTVEIG